MVITKNRILNVKKLIKTLDVYILNNFHKNVKSAQIHIILRMENVYLLHLIKKLKDVECIKI